MKRVLLAVLIAGCALTSNAKTKKLDGKIRWEYVKKSDNEYVKFLWKEINSLWKEVKDMEYGPKRKVLRLDAEELQNELDTEMSAMYPAYKKLTNASK